MTPRVCRDISEMIGDTPLLELPVRNPNAQLYLKMEKTNPGQSMKDRMALSMIEAAERSGRLSPGGTIVESSSGNTATGLALIAASRGYRFIAVVDHHAAREKIDVIRAYGGEIVQVGGDLPADRVAVYEREQTAERLAREIPHAIFLNQADNPDNPAGYGGLADELIQSLGVVQTLVGSIGTGGSLCGTARALKQRSPESKVVAVEPVGSVIFGGQDGPYLQSGTGNPGSVDIAGNVDRSLIDRNRLVSDPAAFNTARFLARRKEVLVGGSGGGVVHEALEIANEEGQTGNVVAIVPDGGEKYISTIFNDEWMKSHDLFDPRVETRLQLLMALSQ